MKLDKDLISQTAEDYIDYIGLTDDQERKEAQEDFENGFDKCRDIVSRSIRKRKQLSTDPAVSLMLHTLLLDFNPI